MNPEDISENGEYTTRLGELQGSLMYADTGQGAIIIKIIWQV